MKNIIHYCKQKKAWTSHTYKECTKAPSILVKGGWSTEVRPERKTNPRGWIVTNHTNVIINPVCEEVTSYKLKQKLIYDKVNMTFNINQGQALLFNEEGAFVLEVL